MARFFLYAKKTFVKRDAKLEFQIELHFLKANKGKIYAFYIDIRMFTASLVNNIHPAIYSQT